MLGAKPFLFYSYKLGDADGCASRDGVRVKRLLMGEGRLAECYEEGEGDTQREETEQDGGQGPARR